MSFPISLTFSSSSLQGVRMTMEDEVILVPFLNIGGKEKKLSVQHESNIEHQSIIQHESNIEHQSIIQHESTIHIQKECPPNNKFSIESESDSFFEKESLSDLYALFSVCDGHGGTAAAVFVRTYLSHFIIREWTIESEIEKILKNAYEKLDKELLHQVHDGSGTTCCTVIISRLTGKMWVANVGDSRAIFVGKNGVKQLSMDHRATRPDEVERIKKAGGFVINKRVMGELAVTRALGDVRFKDPEYNLVTPEPEVTQHLQNGTLVIACDGLFDVMSNEEVAEFIRANKGTLEEKCKVCLL